MRTESQPIGRLIEKFVAAAFTAHPYSNAPIGHRSDLQRYTMTDARAFFERVLRAVEPRDGDRRRDQGEGDHPDHRQVLRADSGAPEARADPHRGAAADCRDRADAARSGAAVLRRGLPQAGGDRIRDEPAYDAMSDILTRGRTSRLYRLLVRDKKLAVAVQGGRGLPGRQVSAPVDRARRARARRHDRRGARRHAPRARAAEDRGRDRRGARAIQDAREGRS